jgi:hypothetical protein
MCIQLWTLGEALLTSGEQCLPDVEESGVIKLTKQRLMPALDAVAVGIPTVRQLLL